MKPERPQDNPKQTILRAQEEFAMANMLFASIISNKMLDTHKKKPNPAKCRSVRFWMKVFHLNSFSHLASFVCVILCEFRFD